MLLETLILQSFRKQCYYRHWFYNISKQHVARTIGVTTFPKRMLLKPLPLHQTNKLLKYLAADLSKIMKLLVLEHLQQQKVAKRSDCWNLFNTAGTTGFSNII